MFIAKLFKFSILCISLHLILLLKSNRSMFNSIKYSLQFDTLLGWIILQVCNLANIDQMKQNLTISVLR